MLMLVSQGSIVHKKRKLGLYPIKYEEHDTLILSLGAEHISYKKMVNIVYSKILSQIAKRSSIINHIKARRLKYLGHPLRQ